MVVVDKVAEVGGVEDQYGFLIILVKLLGVQFFVREFAFLIYDEILFGGSESEVIVFDEENREDQFEEFIVIFGYIQFIIEIFSEFILMDEMFIFRDVMSDEINNEEIEFLF